MPYVHRARPIPVVSVDRGTLLNGSLSPTARLLYAVLLAVVDGEDSVKEAARLVGIDDTDALEPFLEELKAVGVVDVTAHQGSEGGPTVTVHEMPVPSAERIHQCVPCEDCGACTCFDSLRGVCRRCTALRRARRAAEQDIARWTAQKEAGATYTLGTYGRLLHRWDCHTLNSPEKGLELLKAYSADHRDQGGNVDWFPLPELLTAHEVRLLPKQRRSCQVCKPDPV